MSMNGKNGLALVLITMGGLILLGRFGLHTGHMVGFLLGYLVPIAMIVLGYIGILNKRPIIGSLLGIIGLTIILGKLSGLIGMAIAVAMVIYGITILTRGKRSGTV